MYQLAYHLGRSAVHLLNLVCTKHLPMNIVPFSETRSPFLGYGLLLKQSSLNFAENIRESTQKSSQPHVQERTHGSFQRWSMELITSADAFDLLLSFWFFTHNYVDIPVLLISHIIPPPYLPCCEVIKLLVGIALKQIQF